MKKEKIYGIEVSITDYNLLRESVIYDIKKNKKSTVIAINPEKIMKSRDDYELKKILNEATYKIPDGVCVVLASKIKKGKINNRITGVDSMEMLCELSDEKGYKIFMYGAKKEVLVQAKINLKKKYKNINIVGAIDGYQQDSLLVVKKINEKKPNILFVALGSPKQEFWISEHLSKLNVNIIQGVGGSFDVISGNVKRAPKFMQKAGLEWLYRLFKEPKRIFRQFKLIKFIFLVFFRKEDTKYEN